jgi:hypothetical protein
VTLFELGRDVLGPPFCHFVWTVIVRSGERRWDRLLFAAREGHLFRALHERLSARLGIAPPPSSYVYVSRLSTSLASVRGFGEREVLIGLHKGASRSVRELFAAFELWEPAIEARARAAGFDAPDRWIRDAHDPRFARLIADAELQSLVGKRADAARARVKRYFAQEGLVGAERPALVDIGWSGTIQNNLQRAFAGDPEIAPLDGIYFALKKSPLPGNDDPATRKEGVIADWRRDVGLPGLAVFHFLELFEQAARSEHGTTLGYAERDGRVAPVTKEEGPDREAERRAWPAIAELQEGALACADRFAPPDDAAAARRSLQRALERFIFAPSSDEVAAVSALRHTDDWGAESHRALVGDDGPAALLRPRRWLWTFHHSMWKPAFVLRTGGPMLARAYHRYIRWKDSR